jgi:hypothetical protein
MFVYQGIGGGGLDIHVLPVLRSSSMKKLFAIALSAVFPSAAIADDLNAVSVSVAARAAKSADFTMTRWGGDISFTLKPDLSAIPQAQITNMTNAGITQLITPNVDYKFYALPIDDKNPEGGFEFEMDLKSRPSSNVISVPFESTNLDFFYQPPLNKEAHPAYVVSCTETQCFDKEGNVVTERPERVVGSYAVYYHDSDGFQKQGSAKIYKTGKAFHIFRPHLSDSAGKTVWADLFIDTNRKLFQVTIPQDFIDTATYPILKAAGAEFGYHTIGGGWDVATAGYEVAGKPTATAPASFTYTELYIYTKYTTTARALKCGTFAESASYPASSIGANTTGFTPSSTTGAWSACGGTQGAMTSGAYYWGVWFDGAGSNTSIAYDSSGTDYYKGPLGGWTNPYPASATGDTKKFSFYWTYPDTAVASGGVIGDFLINGIGR